MHIGCHLSFSKGYAAMGEKALELGADCFQFFSRNPRGGAAKAFDRDDALALKKNMGGKLVRADARASPENF